MRGDHVVHVDVARVEREARLVNPEIRAIGESVEEGWEGCLSIPGLRGLVPRFSRVKVKALDLAGDPVSLTADGFHARVIQHEYDHIEGKLFTEKLKPIRRRMVKRKLEKIKKGEIRADYKMKFARR